MKNKRYREEIRTKKKFAHQLFLYLDLFVQHMQRLTLQSFFFLLDSCYILKSCWNQMLHSMLFIFGYSFNLRSPTFYTVCFHLNQQWNETERERGSKYNLKWIQCEFYTHCSPIESKRETRLRHSIIFLIIRMSINLCFHVWCVCTRWAENCCKITWISKYKFKLRKIIRYHTRFLSYKYHTYCCLCVVFLNKRKILWVHWN